MSDKRVDNIYAFKAVVPDESVLNKSKDLNSQLERQIKKDTILMYTMLFMFIFCLFVAR